MSYFLTMSLLVLSIVPTKYWLLDIFEKDIVQCAKIM
jgi:hypothetical protein